MKILKLLEAFPAATDEYQPMPPDYVLRGVNVFDEDDGVLDASFSFTNKNNGVTYAVDVLVNLETHAYKVNQIDVKDGKMTHDGDAEDAKVVDKYIKDNFAQLMQEFSNDNVDTPLNKPRPI